MCGISGVFRDSRAFSLVLSSLNELSNRGKDALGVFDGENIHIGSHEKGISVPSTEFGVDSFAMGHCLHAIVGHVPQPVSFGFGTLVANCEIYNWKDLKSGSGLEGDNDAGVLCAYFDHLVALNLEAGRGLFDGFAEALAKLDGVFAFAYVHSGQVFLARDIIGVKPLFYVQTADSFAFASEKKALESMGHVDVKELNPRSCLVYGLEENSLDFVSRELFSISPEHTDELPVLLSEVEKLLDDAILKRVPLGQKVGLLFSGGVDSTYIAIRLKELGVDFTCYTAAVYDPMHSKEPEDLVMSKRAAEELGLDLEIVQIDVSEVEDYLKKVVPLIEDNNVVKASVAATFFVACEKASSDGCRVIFSGLGSEEIFAGYNRHLHSPNVNKECVSGLRKMYERDLYRDDVLTMENRLELRVPFLDHALIDYCLKIPSRFKIVEEEIELVGTDGKKIETRVVTKWILRQVALSKGMPKAFALRPKKAAQYGSRIHHVISKLSRGAGFDRVSSYLSSFYPRHNLKLGVLFSSGKDSCSAAWIMKEQNYKLSCLITMKSLNLDSYMFQSAGVELVSMQAKAMGLPLVEYETEGKKEEELLDLEAAIVLARDTYGINGVVTGALFSSYQRDRIETICDRLGLKVFSPLWHKPQDVHMKEVVRNGFVAVLSAVAGDGLTKSFVGRQIDDTLISDLSQLPGINVAGEGGEFESLVLDGPLFVNGRIEILDFEIEMDSEFSGRMKILDAKFVEKKREGKN